MSLETSLEALMAAIGIEIAKMVVVKYKNNKTVMEELSGHIKEESTLTDIKSIKEVSEEEQDNY
jgi:hypothetical protein